MNTYEEKAIKFATNYGLTNAKLGESRMTVAEVIAMNIQTSQIKEVLLPYERTDVRIQEEKDYFLWWIKNPKLGGRFNFTDNVSAWEMYKLVHATIELDDDEEFTPSWAEDIDNVINQAIRASNYSDYGGQL